MADKELSRREFSVALAAGVVLAGYFAGPGLAEAKGARREPVPSPLLRKDLIAGWDGEFHTLAIGRSKVAVNRVGHAILGYLDGTRGIRDLAHAVGKDLSLPVTETFEAKVAQFVGELAALGFLATPFFVTIVEHEASA